MLRIYLTLILTLITLNSYTVNVKGKVNHHFVGLLYNSNYQNRFILVDSGEEGTSFFYKERKISDTLFIVKGSTLKLFTVVQKVIFKDNELLKSNKDFDDLEYYSRDYFYYVKPLKGVEVTNVEFINKNSFCHYESDYAVFKYSKNNKIVVGYKEKSKEVKKYCYYNRTILRGQLSIDSTNYYQFEEIEESHAYICMKKLGKILRLGWYTEC